MQKTSDEAAPRWMKIVLSCAGIYNLAWGTWVVLFPDALFRWAKMAPPNYPEMWQGMGMVVGVYGLGYWLAARNPIRHWPIVLVGFLGKLFGPLGMLNAIWLGRLPRSSLIMNIFNDVIWLVPFALILWRAYRVHGWRD